MSETITTKQAVGLRTYPLTAPHWQNGRQSARDNVTREGGRYLVSSSWARSQADQAWSLGDAATAARWSGYAEWADEYNGRAATS